MRIRLLVLTAALAVLLAAVGVRIRELDAGSTRTQSSYWIGVTPRELVRAVRPAGSEVVIEVCSAALLRPDALRDVRFSVVDLATGREVAASTVDPQVVRPGNGYACARLTSAAAGRGASRLALRAGSPTPVPSMLAGRILTRRPLTSLDLGLVLALFLVAVALTFAMTRPDDEPARDVGSPAVFAASVLGVAAIAFFAISNLPISGTIGGLARSGLLLAAQLGLVAFAIPRDSKATFGFVRPTRPALVLGLAPFAALAIRIVALGANAVLPATRPSAIARLAVPSTGVTHAETILDPRSGVLAIAAIAVVAPIVEELFFRGVVYGSVERARGRTAAFVVTTLAFVAAHVPQTLGDPSAIVSIATLSIVATFLRMRFRSVAASAAMHLVHNGMLVLVGLLASR